MIEARFWALGFSVDRPASSNSTTQYKTDSTSISSTSAPRHSLEWTTTGDGVCVCVCVRGGGGGKPPCRGSRAFAVSADRIRNG